MAVSRADKAQELQDLTAAFTAADTAIVLDYRGIDVPTVTELRRQLRGAKATYRVVKNTLARKASVGTPFAALETSGLEDQFKFLYAVLSEAGQQVGIAPLFVMDVPFSLTAPPGHRPPRARRRWLWRNTRSAGAPGGRRPSRPSSPRRD